MTTTYTIFTSNGGHSAKSPGAAGCGYKEHEQARLMNAEFIKAMRARGHAVTDTTSDAANATAVLQEQVAKANKVAGGARQLDVSWHLNASGTGKATGTEVHYYSDDAKAIAAAVSASIAKALGLKDRGAKQSKGLYFLKNTRATAILIETCFIDNASDMRSLVKKRTQAAAAVAEALAGPVKQSTGISTSSTATTAKSSYTGSSIVDYLKSLGQDSSFANRAKLAAARGVVPSASQYKGTEQQNTALLAALRKAEG